MDRYNKYLVIKNSDIASFLNDYQKQTLEHLTNIIQNGRLSKGKAPQSYVCVAADWPMYEQVWSMVESFVDGKPNEIEQLTARVRELEEENARLNSEIEMLKSGKRSNIRLGMELAASQAYAEQLREALGQAISVFEGYSVNRKPCYDAMEQPRDTSALDAYMAEKVKEAGKFDMWRTNPYTKVLETSIKQLTKQRDLVVEALEYHQQQTRPIAKTQEALDFLRK